MKTRLLALLTTVAIALPAAVTVAAPVVLTSEAVVLIDPETRQALYDHNSDKRMYPASLTKMMTALLVAENGNLERRVKISAHAAAVGESSMNLAAGEQLQLKHILMGALLPSANDGATACAELVDGSVTEFVAHMNRRARELGMTGTHFVNPTGLHNADHYSTARDLATLAIAVMARPELRPIVRTQQATVPWPGRDYDRKLVNRNRLLARWPMCDGVKTGYTKQAGRCLAASAYVDGWRLIAVVLKSKDAWADAQGLLEWGFAGFDKVALVAGGVTQATVAVRGGTEDSVEVVATEDVIAVLPRGTQPEAPLLDVTSCDAPVTAGETIAHVSVATPDGRQHSVAMAAVSDVPASLWAALWGDPRFVWALAALLSVSLGVLIYAATTEAVGARRLGKSSDM